MDLSAWLLRHTPPRPLVVAVPGGTGARIAAERAIRGRGWRPAMSPVEANVLVVAGVAGPALEPYVRQVWESIPAPRVRVDLPGPSEVRRLDAATEELHDVDRQREQAARPADAHENDHEMPGGIPMADRADDRDGLKLDQLQVPLGPVLPLWPAGLVVHTRLQGDVIQEASVELVGSGGDSFWLDAPPTARRLDSSARLLALAGWTDASTTAQRLRDGALDAPHDLAPELGKWARRVGRSRTLRWLLEGVAPTPDDPSTPEPLTGDALTRLHRWLEAAATPENEPEVTRWTVDNLPSLLAGTELATARLLVASLDPDPDLLTHRDTHRAHHG